MNLIMKDEDAGGDTLGDAVAYLLQKKKKSLVEKTIDGHTKLELFYIFLTEYKFLKEIQEKDTREQRNVMTSHNYVTTKKMTEGWNIKNNKKDYNSLSFHFKSSSSTTPQYMKPTKAYMHSTKPSKSPNKNNNQSWIGNIENDDLLYSWRRIQS